MRFVLIDRLLELEAGRRIVACKTFAAEEEFLKDHFPGFPVIPGALLTEVMVQTGGWLILRTLDFARWPFLCMIEKAKFRRFVKPGENLVIEANLCSTQGDNFEVQAVARVSQNQVAQSRIVYHAPAGLASTDVQLQLETWARETFASLGGHLALTQSEETLREGKKFE
jgi:3-hydroxyacyl-[acyl-carrier-protein] dehydratase